MSIQQAIAALFLAGVLLPSANAATPRESLKFVTLSADYVEISPGKGLAVELRYATANNFMGENLYGEFNRPFLHRNAADKLIKAAALLQAESPGYRLLIFDALRPRSVQQRLWEKVKGTPQQPYVANPATGSMHNYGFAVDLTVVDELGHELDMGTPYDSFAPLAQPRLEDAHLGEGSLSGRQLENRLLLRRAMEQAGFIQLPLEWWHYDSLPKQEVKLNYKMVE